MDHRRRERGIQGGTHVDMRVQFYENIYESPLAESEKGYAMTPITIGSG